MKGTVMELQLLSLRVLLNLD